MAEKKYKVLVIEDHDIELIKIQEWLIGREDFKCRLPFELPVDDQTVANRSTFKKEISLLPNAKTVRTTECLTNEESSFIELLNRGDGLQDVKSTVATIIKENYQELRLIICDLELCQDEKAGTEIIKHIREGFIPMEDKKWFLQNIPIVILTHLEGMNPLLGLEGARGNSILIRKGDLYTDTEIKGVACSVFSSFIKKMADDFDRFCNDNIKKYKVALSFSSINDISSENPIRHKEFVRLFKQYLYGKYTKEKVYYFEDDNTSSNVADDLDKIYNNDSEYVIVFISQDYNTDAKQITQREWEAIQKRYDGYGWGKVIFVTYEDYANNALTIGQILRLKRFNEVFIPFCDLRKELYDTFSNSNNEHNGIEIINSYHQLFEKISTRIEEKIIPRIK